MKVIPMTLVLACMVLATACGSSNESSSTTTTTYQVNGKTPDEYFRQFFYKETGTCGTARETHHYAKSETVKIGVTGAGKDILATLSVLMREDGSFAAFYQEVVVLRYFDSGYYWDSHQERIVRGVWRVNGDRLELSGLGSASALQYNGAPAMQMQVPYNLISNGLKEQTLLIRRIQASYNPVPDYDPCFGK